MSKIPALFFDKDGLGPDEVALESTPVRQIHPKDRPALSLRIRSNGLAMRAPIDAGFFMYREQVLELHTELGAWLEKSRNENPCGNTSPSPRHATGSGQRATGQEA